MINYDFNSLFVGAIIGSSQTIMGHPLDTLKTIKQNSDKIVKFNKFNIFSLYKGIKYPLIVNTIYNSSLFYLFDKLNNDKYNKINIGYAGFVSGFYSGFILTPFEYYKVNSQVGNKIVFLGKKYNPLRGVFLTMFREGIASSIYFSTYYSLESNQIPILISGGLAGSLSWFLTYPIDTIKTRYQIRAINSKQLIDLFSIKTIMDKTMWNGIGYCLTRAFVVNSVSFYLYNIISSDTFNNKQNNNSYVS